MEINVITPDGVVAPFLRITGQSSSEITGPAFSPDGSRLYFSSQRGTSGAVAPAASPTRCAARSGPDRPPGAILRRAGGADGV